MIVKEMNMCPEHKEVIVTTVGGNYYGQSKLDELLSEGWQVLSCDDNLTWVDDQGYHCREYVYNLIHY
jgi:hypothetical protein